MTSMNATPHTAFKQLPLVDVSGLFSADLATRTSAAAILGRAAREAGFLYISGHGVPRHLIDRLVARATAYFAQPLDDKMRDYIGLSDNHSGYVPEGEEQFYSAKPDLKEAYDVGFDLGGLDVVTREAKRRPMLGANRWSAFPGFREDVKAYYDAVYALSLVLFKGFALALDLPEDTFTQHVTTPPSQLRLVHYPYNPDAAADRPGIGAHTDYECFTILLPTADGLEVMNGAGEWIDAPVVPDTFVINIGDMMEVLSNGNFVATSHRVRKVTQERYSFPLFCACDYDTVIAPLPALVQTGESSRYAPVVCGEHLYAQTMQTFSYLKQALADGRLQLPAGAKALSSFGHKPQDSGAQA
ncbi:MAG TPA: 2-oxoglutarate and iron-dependent oxygenase domain-containing protein [Rhodocyclaceae bacterium]|nr:2-oxoglutarate and iron-dependent oxygenase domain-containing protein [Rhodocyclaceae bacterium]